MNRNKKHSKVPEEMYWDCSVCTYRNKPKAFKCQVCDVRKGTSTRKPKINPRIAAQHSSQSSSTNVHTKIIKKDEQLEIISSRKPKKSWQPSRLKNVDRNSGQACDVTINNLTISVTEYRLKDKNKSSSRDHSDKLSVETKNRSTSSGNVKKLSKVNR